MKALLLAVEVARARAALVQWQEEQAEWQPRRVCARGASSRSRTRRAGGSRNGSAWCGIA